MKVTSDTQATDEIEVEVTAKHSARCCKVHSDGGADVKDSKRACVESTWRIDTQAPICGPALLYVYICLGAQQEARECVWRRYYV